MVRAWNTEYPLQQIFEYLKKTFIFPKDFDKKVSDQVNRNSEFFTLSKAKNLKSRREALKVSQKFLSNCSGVSLAGVRRAEKNGHIQNQVLSRIEFALELLEKFKLENTDSGNLHNHAISRDEIKNALQLLTKFFDDEITF